MDVQKSSSRSPRQSATAGTVTVRPLLLKPQWMNGLSERLLVSHYVNNYGGAVRRLNAISARLAALDWERAPAFEINGLKREELIAAGSVILHEIYFELYSPRSAKSAHRIDRAARRACGGPRARLRQRHGLACGIHRHRKGSSRRLGMAEPRLV